MSGHGEKIHTPYGDKIEQATTPDELADLRKQITETLHAAKEEQRTLKRALHSLSGELESIHDHITRLHVQKRLSAMTQRFSVIEKEAKLLQLDLNAILKRNTKEGHVANIFVGGINRVLDVAIETAGIFNKGVRYVGKKGPTDEETARDARETIAQKMDLALAHSLGPIEYKGIDLDDKNTYLSEALRDVANANTLAHLNSLFVTISGTVHDLKLRGHGNKLIPLAGLQRAITSADASDMRPLVLLSRQLISSPLQQTIIRLLEEKKVKDAEEHEKKAREPLTSTEPGAVRERNELRETIMASCDGILGSVTVELPTADIAWDDLKKKAKQFTDAMATVSETIKGAKLLGELYYALPEPGSIDIFFDQRKQLSYKQLRALLWDSILNEEKRSDLVNKWSELPESIVKDRLRMALVGEVEISEGDKAPVDEAFGDEVQTFGEFFRRINGVDPLVRENILHMAFPENLKNDIITLLYTDSDIVGLKNTVDDPVLQACFKRLLTYLKGIIESMGNRKDYFHAMFWNTRIARTDSEKMELAGLTWTEFLNEATTLSKEQGKLRDSLLAYLDYLMVHGWTGHLEEGKIPDPSSIDHDAVKEGEIITDDGEAIPMPIQGPEDSVDAKIVPEPAIAGEVVDSPDVKSEPLVDALDAEVVEYLPVLEDRISKAESFGDVYRVFTHMGEQRMNSISVRSNDGTYATYYTPKLELIVDTIERDLKKNKALPEELIARLPTKKIQEKIRDLCDDYLYEREQEAKEREVLNKKETVKDLISTWNNRLINLRTHFSTERQPISLTDITIADLKTKDPRIKNGNKINIARFKELLAAHYGAVPEFENTAWQSFMELLMEGEIMDEPASAEPISPSPEPPPSTPAPSAEAVGDATPVQTTAEIERYRQKIDNAPTFQALADTLRDTLGNNKDISYVTGLKPDELKYLIDRLEAAHSGDRRILQAFVTLLPLGALKLKEKIEALMSSPAEKEPSFDEKVRMAMTEEEFMRVIDDSDDEIIY